MNNRQDLEFLRYAESQDIKVLSNYVIKNKHGQTLTWENIVDELLLMGGNTLVNHFRGHGRCSAKVHSRNVARKSTPKATGTNVERVGDSSPELH